MRSICLFLARFSLPAWVGASVLFVILTVAEVRHPEFSSTTRNILAALRFPWFYRFGFVLLGVATAATLVAAIIPGPNRGRVGILAAITTLTLGLMIVDYFLIYRPLEEMVQLNDQAKPANFVSYHNVSKYINYGGSVCATLAAVLACVPVSSAVEEKTKIIAANG